MACERLMLQTWNSSRVFHENKDRIYECAFGGAESKSKVQRIQSQIFQIIEKVFLTQLFPTVGEREVRRVEICDKFYVFNTVFDSLYLDEFKGPWNNSNHGYFDRTTLDSFFREGVAVEGSGLFLDEEVWAGIDQPASQAVSEALNVLTQKVKSEDADPLQKDAFKHILQDFTCKKQDELKWPEPHDREFANYDPGLLGASRSTGELGICFERFCSSERCVLDTFPQVSKSDSGTSAGSATQSKRENKKRKHSDVEDSVQQKARQAKWTGHDFESVQGR